MNTEWVDDLTSSEEAEDVSYGFCVPLKDGGVAWLIPTYEDTYIQKSEDGHWYTLEQLHRKGILKKDRQTTLKTYLEEIRSGEGNWIISPDHDNSDMKWNELDYENASVVKRVTKVTCEYAYEAVEDAHE